ncbi:MAG: hypothetical protein KF841_06800 [Phycisphaerae bacterium]|nr:hypothetical protein [Phycisphaerae bacterium]
MMTVMAVWLFASVPALPPKKPLPPVPGYDWMAPPKRIGEAAPPPLPASEVIAGFLKYIASAPTLSPDAVRFVTTQREKMPESELVDFINLAYAVLSPEFKEGLALLDADKSNDAAVVFERLAQSDDPYLATASANLGATALIDLELIDRCEAMLCDVRDRHRPIEKYTTASDHFRFMLGYCQVHNLEYELAYGTFEDFLKNYPNAPERLRTTAVQIMTELSRRAPGQIGDVRDLLTFAKRKLKTGYTDDTTLNRQDEAVELLAALIEEAEQQEQSNQNGEGEGRGGRGRSSGKNPGGGATESTLPTGTPGETRLRASTAKPGETWGKMPPREREQILQTLQKQFPSQYRELLEQYYRELSKESP